jgi:hypothetical protein
MYQQVHTTSPVKNAMPLLEEIFYSIGQTKVFNALDLRFRYHQLPFCENDKVKIVLWGIDQNGKDCLYINENSYLLL